MLDLLKWCDFLEHFLGSVKMHFSYSHAAILALIILKYILFRVRLSNEVCRRS